LITRLTVFLPHPNRSPKSTNDKEMSLRAAATMFALSCSRIAFRTGSEMYGSLMVSPRVALAVDPIDTDACHEQGAETAADD